MHSPADRVRCGTENSARSHAGERERSLPRRALRLFARAPRARAIGHFFGCHGAAIGAVGEIGHDFARARGRDFAVRRREGSLRRFFSRFSSVGPIAWLNGPVTIRLLMKCSVGERPMRGGPLIAACRSTAARASTGSLVLTGSLALIERLALTGRLSGSGAGLE